MMQQGLKLWHTFPLQSQHGKALFTLLRMLDERTQPACKISVEANASRPRLTH